jgi:hypothetical protein
MEKAGGMTQVVECLPGKGEVLSVQTPAPPKKKEKQKVRILFVSLNLYRFSMYFF